jgi:hypothetical protein
MQCKPKYISALAALGLFMGKSRKVMGKRRKVLIMGKSREVLISSLRQT